MSEKRRGVENEKMPRRAEVHQGSDASRREELEE